LKALRRVKAIRPPTGEKAGSKSFAWLWVSCRLLPMSKSQMSYVPARLLERAIRTLFGAQAGSVSSFGLFVRRWNEAPGSTEEMKTSLLPNRSLTNAIRLPSGDQAGS
jgi:hypothetical protein